MDIESTIEGKKAILLDGTSYGQIKGLVNVSFRPQYAELPGADRVLDRFQVGETVALNLCSVQVSNPERFLRACFPKDELPQYHRLEVSCTREDGSRVRVELPKAKLGKPALDRYGRIEMTAEAIGGLHIHHTWASRLRRIHRRKERKRRLADCRKRWARHRGAR